MTDYDGEPDEHRHQRVDRDAQERRLAERERAAKAMTLTEFLLARIAEDEERHGHYKVQPSDFGDLDTPDGGCVPCDVYPPGRCRVLAECAVKRRIMEEYEGHRGSVMAYRSPRWRDAMNEQDRRGWGKAEARGGDVGPAETAAHGIEQVA